MPADDTVVETIRAMIEAVNAGDMPTAMAAFAANAVIVEDIAPFRWTGSEAPFEWLSAMAGNAARQNIRSITMTIGRPTRLLVEADRAYAVFAGRLELGTDQADLAADGHLTFTLQAEGESWLIDTLVWSGPGPTTADR